MSSALPHSPCISVIVCTYGRAEPLRDCLASLSVQTLPPQLYEVLVVDNNPFRSRSIQDIVQDFQSGAFSSCPHGLMLLHSPVQGLSYARNAGIAEARGDILGFIDDDAVACPDWLEQIAGAFATHPGAGVIGGHVLLQVPTPRPKIFKEGLERYWSQFISPYRSYTEVDEWDKFPWGANWSARRKALLEIGGFPSTYGRQGDDFRGGEELVAATEIRALGYTVGVLPQAQVLHKAELSRFTLRHIWRTILSSTLVTYQAQRDSYVPPRKFRGGDGTAIRHSLRHIFLPSGDAGSQHVYPEIVALRAAAHIVLAAYRLRDFASSWFRSLRLRLQRAR